MVGGRDLVRHVLACQRSERIGRGNLHVLGNGAGAHVKRAAENVGKAQNVVDLVGVVGASRGDDGVIADLAHGFGANFRFGIGHRKDDRLARH